MKVLFDEEDLIDSVCIFAALQYDKDLEQMEAELFHDEEKGFSAAASAENGQYTYPLSEQDIIDGVAMYLRDYHNFEPQRLVIELFYDEATGYSAEIEQE